MKMKPPTPETNGYAPLSGISQEFLSGLFSFSGEERSIGVDNEIDLSLRSWLA
jgi:hypothetical protein